MKSKEEIQSIKSVIDELSYIFIKYEYTNKEIEELLRALTKYYTNYSGELLNVEDKKILGIYK